MLAILLSSENINSLINSKDCFMVKCKRLQTVLRPRMTAMSLALGISCSGYVCAYAAPDPQITETAEELMEISGTVKDSDGMPLIGANVQEKGTTRGVVTDIDGKFTLKVSADADVMFSYLGYSSMTLKPSSEMNVVLSTDNAMLDEVVVVAYGTQKKVNLTGAVSVVDVDKALDSKPQMEVSKALQGVVPGLSIVSTNGNINGQPSMQIRGIGTLTGDGGEPLIVLDGVPIDDLSMVNPQDIASVSVLKDAASTSIYGSRAAFGVVLITTKSGVKTDKISVSYSNNFSWDTPTILPDYPDVPTQLIAMNDAAVRTGAASNLFGMDFMETLKYAEAWKEQNGGNKAGYREMRPFKSWDDVGDYYVNPDGSGALYYADWDVKNIMFQKWTPSQSHNVNIQGTSGRTSYYLSFGYDQKEGQMEFNPDKLKRYTVNVNVQSDITDWLQAGVRVNYTDRTYTTPETQRSTYLYMWRWGSFFGPYGTVNGTDFRNDIAYRKQAGDSNTGSKYARIGAFMKAYVTKGLSVNADYTYNVDNVRVDNVGLPVTSYDSWGGNISSPSVVSSSSYLYQESDETQSYALNVYANYEFSLNKQHNFNIMLGGTAEGGETQWFYAQQLGLLNSSQPEFPLANGTETVDGGHSHWATAGYFGRINYNWKEIWLFELNGRFDGSSRFPANDRWAFFPSGSMGYRFSQENYFEPLRDVVSNGKLRFSYGAIGNEAVGDNRFVSVIGGSSPSWINPSTGSLMTGYDMPTLVSRTLTWERIETLDVGLDLGFLDNKLNLGFDWYQRYTRNMLAPGKELPDMLGTGSPYTNAGELRSRGWELSLDYRDRFGDVDVYGNFSIGDFSAEVTKWSNESGIISDEYVGKKYGEIWGFETDRLFTEDDFTWGDDGSGNRVCTGYAPGVADQTKLEQGSFVYGPGDIKFKDLNGDGKIDGGNGTVNDHGDLTVIGNTTPRYQYSFRLGAAWKGFDIDMYFQGVGKWQQWTTSAFVIPFARGIDGIYSNMTDYYTPENKNYGAFYPRMFSGNGAGGTVAGVSYGRYNFYPQSRYLLDRSYLRFKNLTVGYTFPQQLTRKAYIEKVRVYFSANNLCELINNSFAPLDPEIDGTVGTDGSWGRTDPYTRSVSCGVQVTF